MENTEVKRPTFLTVLCILSYIGVGLAIISAVLGIFALESTKAMVSSAAGMAGDALGSGSSVLNDAIEGAKKLYDWGYVIYGIQIIAAIICLIGVLKMWRLKKIGYYIYIVGEILPAISTFIFLGGFGPLGGTALASGLIFPVIFIILYGLNLKHMS